jgi:hypothetical protein
VGVGFESNIETRMIFRVCPEMGYIISHYVALFIRKNIISYVDTGYPIYLFLDKLIFSIDSSKACTSFIMCQYVCLFLAGFTIHCCGGSIKTTTCK